METAAIADESQDVHLSWNADNLKGLQREGLANEATGSESTSMDDGDESFGPPQAKFKVLDKVYARDTDGILYQAVIRRALYGPIYHQQVQVAMVKSAEEVSEVFSREDNKDSWQYFVHFLKWNVAWDRWVPEFKVLPLSDETRKYAETLAEEHKRLRAALTRKTPGKKAFQNLDTAAFLSEWRKALDRIDQQFLMKTIPPTMSPPEEAPTKPPQTAQWSKAAVQAEIALRSKGLISKKFEPPSNVIFLPFTLKKVLVEGWEIINQCGMVAKIPADVSVREVLAQYLTSKGISPPSHSAKQGSLIKPELGVEGVNIHSNQAAAKTEPSLSGCLDTSVDEVQGSPSIAKNKDSDDATSFFNSTPNDGDIAKKKMQDEEWNNMSAGIIQLFEEALPKRLLYKDELFQLQVLDSQQETSQQSYADIYGCEHLLRLLVSLPSLMADTMTEDESRPIIAKLNDFVRYMYKNQTILFQQTYRKLSDLELEVREKEQTRKAQKRKRPEEESLVSLSSRLMRP